MEDDYSISITWNLEEIIDKAETVGIKLKRGQAVSVLKAIEQKYYDDMCIMDDFAMSEIFKKDNKRGK